MSNTYNTINSSLFLNDHKALIPDWINETTFSYTKKTNELEDVTKDFVKEAAFNYMPSVQRDNVDGTARSTFQQRNSSQLVMMAKLELAKFLTGKYYTASAKEIRDRSGIGIELEVSISNVPAKFLFKYANGISHVIPNKTFIITNVQNDDSKEAEYPWSKAGLEEALTDIRLGRVKTADKAPAYKAYTITLAEVMKRYNGDARQAMDRVKELLASQEIIGVGSNEFASVYAMDSLFPRLQKEGSIDNVPTFEFVQNIEHTAMKPFSSSDKLVAAASNKLRHLADDFQILSSFRDKDNLVINAKILKNGLTRIASFNFDIVNDKVDNLNFIESNGERIDLNKQTDLSKTYQERTATVDNHITNKIFLTKRDIINKLSQVVDKNIINQLITNWEQRKLIKRVATDKFTSDLSFNDLLNQVDTKVLSKDEAMNILRFANKNEADLHRINQKDMGIRNDQELIYSHSIRLASLYNRLSYYLDKFDLVECNDDVTNVKLNNYSERGKEAVNVTASYQGNKLDKVSIIGSKQLTAALKNYKHISKKNVYAKSVFSENNLKTIIAQVFKNPDKVVAKVKEHFNLQDLGNTFYASEVPLSVIINTLEKAKMAMALSDNERKEFLVKAAKDVPYLTASYAKNTGVRNDYEIESSNILRLASTYNYLSKHLPSFVLNNVSENAEKIELNVNTDKGIEHLTITARYNGNKLKHINIPKFANDSQALKLYKKAHSAKAGYSRAIFTPIMLRKVYSSIFKDVDKAINITLEEYAKSLSNNYYGSEYTLPSIIHNISKELQVLSKEERMEQLQQASLSKDKMIVAAYLNDTGYRTNQEILYTASIRLANVYQAFAKNNNKFIIASFNKDITQVDIGTPTLAGLQKDHYEIDYDVNTPKTITRVSSFVPEQKEIIEQYQNIHGNQLSNIATKAVFSRAMVRTAIKNMVSSEQLNTIVDHILKQAQSLGNELYASNKPLIQLINDANLVYDRPKELDQHTLYREDIKDTGTRDIIYTDTLISAMNNASAYLHKFFKDIEAVDANLQNDVLNYSAKLFDNASGLVNNISFKFELENGHIKDCKVIVNGQLVPISEIKRLFNTNDILKRYLRFNSNDKTNSSIVFSKGQLANKLKDILDSTEQIDQTLDNWEQIGRIKRIASNAYASNYTLETLLSLSNLIPLDDEELKKRLNRKNSLYKSSAIHLKDTGNREIIDKWDENKFIQFARSELNKKYVTAQILDIDLNDKYFSVKARVPYNGIMNISDFRWELVNDRPGQLFINMPDIDTQVKKYVNRFTTPIPYHDKVVININALISSLLGVVDRQSIKTAINQYLANGILKKINSTQFASDYSIPELVLQMKQDNFINEEKNKQELSNSIRKEALHHVTAVDSTMRPQPKEKNEIALKDASQKLINNIKLAANNQLITKRKQNEWIELINQNLHNIKQVAKEFKEYLRN